ncbi:WD40 repeat domain-containing protein, partial [Rodentibacter myodis]
ASIDWKGNLVLWDIPNKEKTVLSRNASGGSMYFIPNSHEFMWQDKDNIVHIQNVKGDEIFSFPHFKTFGHAISEDKTFYISANHSGKIYKGYGDNLIPIYTDTPIGNYENLRLTNKYILSVGYGIGGKYPAKINPTANPINPDVYKKSSYDGVTLWDRATLKPIARLYGNAGKTTGIISPDEKWVITGDENARNRMWGIDNLMNRFSLSDPYDGIYNLSAGEYDKSRLMPLTKEQFKRMMRQFTVAYAFLTETDFIRIGYIYEDSPHKTIASIYSVGDPWLKGFVDLGTSPMISANNYFNSQTFASSPQAHILVTGQAHGGGINVYKYHPDKIELEKIWVAH